jgi:hypothetical protein
LSSTALSTLGVAIKGATSFSSLENVRKYVKPKPISRQNKKLTQQHNRKKVPPAHAQRVFFAG